MLPTAMTVKTRPATAALTLGRPNAVATERDRVAIASNHRDRVAIASNERSLKDQAMPHRTAIPMKLNAHDRGAPSAPPLVTTIGMLAKNIAPGTAKAHGAEPTRRRLRHRTSRDHRNNASTTNGNR